MTATTVFLASFAASMVAGTIILAQSPEAHAGVGEVIFDTHVEASR